MFERRLVSLKVCWASGSARTNSSVSGESVELRQRLAQVTSNAML